ncbi:hypothetical protein AB0D12_31785 [Streptomyces sp. NPDC048479]|uniref:hypothetical protein n=1 Tax=Streptomyces sp. NPDC048479 TaxID=3154725 RepID=UPI00341CDE02
MSQDRTRSTSTIPPTSPDSPQANEALRQVVAGQVGPRRPGVVYDNTDGIFEVLAVTTDVAEARRVLKRRAAQFAITVHELVSDTVDTIGTVWTGSDRVLKAVA